MDQSVRFCEERLPEFAANLAVKRYRQAATKTGPQARAESKPFDMPPITLSVPPCPKFMENPAPTVADVRLSNP